VGAERLLQFPEAANRRRGHVLVRLSMFSDATESDLWLSARIVEPPYQTEPDSVQVAAKQWLPRAVRLVGLDKLRLQRPLLLRA